MELFVGIIIVLVCLLFIIGDCVSSKIRYDIKRLQRENLHFKSKISNLEFKLRSETIKNDLREIQRRNEKLDRMVRGN